MDVPSQASQNVSPEKAPTSAERIRLILAKRIVTGEIPPGTALDESALAAELEVSRTPVREALRQLASSGLVDQRPHRKALVRKPEADALEGMFEVMGYLEGLCASLAAARMTLEERQSLRNLHESMREIVHAGKTEDYVIANEAFHTMIYEGAHNSYLSELALSTRQRVQPFRRAQFSSLGRLTSSHAEHSAIVEAILQGDRMAAEAGMHAHIGLVEQAYYRYAGSLGAK